MELKQYAMEYNGKYYINILPLEDKVPKLEWTKWQSDDMVKEDLEKMNWDDRINGIGGVSGINNWRCLDFDGVKDIKIVEKFVEELGLTSSYEWIVKSGSGKGYHIWFTAEDREGLLDGFGGEKSYYKFKPKRMSDCDHIELRWKSCQTVLPPSIHPSGKKYEFINKSGDEIPGNSPSNIWIGKLINVLNELCVVERERTTKIRKVRCRSIRPIELSGQESETLGKAVDAIKGKIEGYDDWIRAGFALASLGEAGREKFIEISSESEKYKDSEEELNEKFDSLLRDYDGRIKLGTFYKIAEKYGYERPVPQFWYERNDKLEIDEVVYQDFLKRMGFGKFYLGKDYIFVRERDNVLEEVNPSIIKDFVVRYVRNLPYRVSPNFNRNDLRRKLLNKNHKLFGETYLEFIDPIRIEFMKDKYDRSFFFYENCFVEVTKDAIIPQSYENLGGTIWEKSKIKRDFRIVETETEFTRFLWNVCGKDKDRYNALRSAIGYMLHRYKDPSLSKAVIFIDEKLSDAAFGRSGKGLVTNGIGKLRNLVEIDGKRFKIDGNFAFQSVGVDTDIIYFDDANKRFPFEKLFSIITGGLNVEKKNQPEFHIPFEDAPKIIITTNYSVQGTDDSTLDRQFVVEFTDHYNKRFRPVNEFGHRFFDDWNEQEWLEFDNFMLGCVRYYLSEGLVEYEHVNLMEKQLIDSTSPEFAEFIEDMELGKEYNKKELYAEFQEMYPDYDKLHQNTFTGWIKRYANLKELKVQERKSGKERWISING